MSAAEQNPDHAGEQHKSLASSVIYQEAPLYEEHSASVVLRWCTLQHFSGKNLMMANQPFLANVNSCSCSLYVVVRPSVCRLSVRLSVVCL